ncbi:hypothetical protein NA57DRAFT_54312 [Rhizodiscina lignyota]|uniref:Zn(2)-C6 fungal-type domain-containing protein n=1 Tax=Rhizodiscina lignyota TaxID=1504668 RepID=A0A9P4IFW5_9PEZI|nr:hypothetical protein NA57DRAFT_54312 [Rhizodiscina lignyota]
MTYPNADQHSEECQRLVAPRAHKKSRKGCKTCKERKIKCDETHPLCVNCKIYFQGSKKTCEYNVDISSPGQVGTMAKDTGDIETDETVFSIFKSTQHARRRSAPSVPKFIDPELLDPFQTHPPTSENNADYLLKHYFSTCVFNMFPFYPAPGKNPQTEYYAPIIYSDEVLYHVTLQLSAIHLEKSHAKTDVRQSKRLMSECIRLLRERVQHSSDSGVAVSDQTISAVAGLAAIEHEKGNIRMVQMHIQGLKKMAEIRGGFNGLRKSNAMVANIVFCMFVAAVDEPFPIIDLVNGIENPQWYYEVLPRFDAFEYVDFEEYGVDVEFAACLRNIRLLAATYQTAEDCDSTQTYLSVLTFLCSTLQRILSLSPVLEQGSERYLIAEACRWTAALHVFSQWCGHQPDPILMVSKAQHDLKEALRPLMITGAANPVLLWLLSAGGVGAFGSPERTWFVGHLACMVGEMGISSWEDMRATLKRVIWHELQDEPTHRLLWGEIVERIDNLDT